jgi:hypothetical protein
VEFLIIPFIQIGIVLGLVITFDMLSVSRKLSLFLAFILVGIFVGWISATGGGEAAFAWNPLGVLLGDWVYHYTITNYGDPHSAMAHYTIPWIARIPQIYLLCTLVIYGSVGIMAETIYIVVKLTVKKSTAIIAKSLSRRTIVATTLSLIGLFVVLGLTANWVHALYNADEGPPNEPQVFGVSYGGEGPLPDWPRITTFEVSDLSMYGRVQIGYELMVSASVTNTGDSRGIAEVEIFIDGEFMKSDDVALLANESKTVEFTVLTYQPGVYEVDMHGQTKLYWVSEHLGY